MRELNERLRERVYGEGVFVEVTGRKVGRLWELYRESLKERLAA